ncbi:hypothetical protein I6A84_35460 [Frankia sp. CNm7]|uniref:VWFA domain-containing protein n=1 Tax=Frankia nepalensis TaxID=1836974 RepID=A0A937UK72_9ACTN|nr:hypothetical protein [Frankia nepalensis]MBL7494804.1 hypothetical protein [Frankia nepalensis]MBL7514101.1 hypothetical protein [Frankia nepalensis]MBL7523240.1 hypothetical protein [Frankia nepalensis]MBL7626519.1 hypothetical protein [Frankia nepalensis]
MSTFGAPRPLRRLALALAGLLALVPALAACDLSSITGQKASDCSIYQDEEANDEALPLLLFLLDLSGNSPTTAQQVSQALRPYLDTALAEGGYVKLISSGGAGTELRTDPCFSGDAPYLVDRTNDTREMKDREAGGEALQTEIDHIVQQTSVSASGSATSLLAAINDDVQSLRSTPGVRIGEVTVVVWSDLLGTGQRDDCLNVDDKEASVQVAEALVTRCFSASQISVVDDAKIHFIGMNQGNLTPPQQELARYLRDELCRRLSSDCS